MTLETDGARRRSWIAVALGPLERVDRWGGDSAKERGFFNCCAGGRDQTAVARQYAPPESALLGDSAQNRTRLVAHFRRRDDHQCGGSCPRGHGHPLAALIASRWRRLGVTHRPPVTRRVTVTRVARQVRPKRPRPSTLRARSGTSETGWAGGAIFADDVNKSGRNGRAEAVAEAAEEPLCCFICNVDCLTADSWVEVGLGRCERARTCAVEVQSRRLEGSRRGWASASAA